MATLCPPTVRGDISILEPELGSKTPWLDVGSARGRGCAGGAAPARPAGRAAVRGCPGRTVRPGPIVAAADRDERQAQTPRPRRERPDPRRGVTLASCRVPAHLMSILTRSGTLRTARGRHDDGQRQRRGTEVMPPSTIATSVPRRVGIDQCVHPFNPGQRRRVTSAADFSSSALKSPVYVRRTPYSGV